MAFLAPGDQARAGLGDDGITIANPLVAEESVLRTSILPGLLKAAGQPTGAEIEAAAREAGLDYRFIPVSGGLAPDQAEPVKAVPTRKPPAETERAPAVPERVA